MLHTLAHSVLLGAFIAAAVRLERKVVPVTATATVHTDANGGDDDGDDDDDSGGGSGGGDKLKAD